MSNIAIRVHCLGKQYRIGTKLKKRDTLRDALVDTLTALPRRARRLWRGRAASAGGPDETIWALKDVSFDIERGEVVGVIGSNGAGKSTLLKILSRITEPTAGYAELHGSVGSLLETGVGFHPELTGRENIYLNGAILAMAKAEVDRKFDEIVAFSGVEKFIDTPVKRYSSGMRLRLGFAVAAHMDTGILLIDEVLAVGDAAFQQKCLGRISSVTKKGRTVLFVSHDMGAITRLCERTIWLEGGQIRLIGPSVDVVESYLSSRAVRRSSWVNPAVASPDTEVQIKMVRVLSKDGQPITVVAFDRAFEIEITYDVMAPVRDLAIGYHILNSQGVVLVESNETDTLELKGVTRQIGQYTAVCQVPTPLLKPGRYLISVYADIPRVKIADGHEGVLTFDVSKSGYFLNPGHRGIVAPVLEWRIAPTRPLCHKFLG